MSEPNFRVYLALNRAFDRGLDQIAYVSSRIQGALRRSKQRSELHGMLFVGGRKNAYNSVRQEPELIERLVEIISSRVESVKVRIYASEVIMRLAADGFDVSKVRSKLEDLTFKRKVPFAAEKYLDAALAGVIKEIPPFSDGF